MDGSKAGFASIDEYIADFPPEIRDKLSQIREVIREAAPEATEKISYQMPTFDLHGNLVHFAAFKNHIGFYPAPRGIEAFKEELAAYKGAKGSVQFPLDRPLPLDLIGRIARFRAEENKERAAANSKKKS
ncbi:iron chaperone [Cohnella cellulosilytica]|uniref:Iron chaperone n=1 Tax=Cohnella cellulosilytica TaxID=986710 RepID=A0ABW2F4G4_9BACL